jgi:hypothetical protein
LLVDQRNAHDFRLTKYDNSDALSFVLFKDASAEKGIKKTTGFILNSSYKLVKTVKASDGTAGLNMHEFNIIDGGERALVIATRTQSANESTLNIGMQDWQEDQLIDSYGFQEVEVRTGRTLFEWWALDHVPVSDTQVTKHKKKLDYLLVSPTTLILSKTHQTDNILPLNQQPLKLCRQKRTR